MTAVYAFPSAFDVPEAKITRYLFAFHHPDGRGKALFLLRFGFDAGRPIELMAALLEHPSIETMTRTFDAPHGVKYHFDGPLRTPDGRDPVIRTVWQIDHDGDGSTARFITMKIRVQRGVPSMPPPRNA